MDLIASYLVRILNIFFHIMPISFDLWIARRLGAVAYALSGKRKRIAYANLKAAFCREKTPRELKKITWNTYINMAQTFVEILAMTKMDAAYIDKYVILHDKDRIDRAAENPKGMMFVSAHLDNWELSTVVSFFIDHPLYLLARDQKMKRLNELLNRLREVKGNFVIRKGTDIKNIFKVLHQGKSVGILADQNAGVNGKLLNFFGRDASCPIGPYRIAQKSGAWILPSFMERVKGPYHELYIEPHMIVEKDEDITQYMKEYNRLLEKHIRKSPDQWMWMHKKWKITPVKYVVVLDDGKKGHLKQSLAVVDQMKRYRESEDKRSEDLKVEVVRVEFKDKKAKTMFNIRSPFFGARCQGCLKCMKRALTADSYMELTQKYADIIVGCGSNVSGVNRLLKIENNARNLAILDPGVLLRNKFDVVVMPKHDFDKTRGKKDENIVVTDLAPNTIETFPKINSDERKCIGLLFGGDNPHFCFTGKLAGKVVKGVKNVCEEEGALSYVTTSRRTPKVAEEKLAEELENDSHCIEFISGKNDTDEYTVEKILKRSYVVIVSGESISMVSEAVSSGRKVLVFMPEKRVEKVTKYEKFLKNLSDKGYIKLIEPDNVAQEIKRVISEAEESFDKTQIEEDKKRVREKMYKLF